MRTDNRPKAFVSSTIYDFRDLRSALKYWMEEMGYQVLFSEFNDFPQSPDQNSYESCLASIDDCQYFILLVGNRVGGLMPDGISITRAEYRRAYENLKKGTLKIIPFVRREIWTIREDRKALAKHLDTTEKRLSQPTKQRIKNLKSTFVDDPGHIFDFMGEISRNAEMKDASSSGVLPIGNWVYQFDTFRDVIDTLAVQIRAGTPMRKAAQIANLKHEIYLNLTSLYRRQNGSYWPITAMLKEILARYPDDGTVSHRNVAARDLIPLAEFVRLVASLTPLSNLVLNAAILSGDFLEYDNASHQFTFGPIQTALLQISYRHEALRSQRSKSLSDRFMQYVDEIKKGASHISIPITDIMHAWNYFGTIYDLYFLSKHLLAALDGDDSVLRNTSFTLQMPDSLKESAERQPPIAFIEELYGHKWDEISM